MQHFWISTERVHRQLARLNTNKSEGADEIHPKILASLVRFLATPLAKQCQIYKKGSKDDVATCRPICLTSVVRKIMERTVKSGILQYFKTGSLLNDLQHGIVPRLLCLILIIADELISGLIDRGESLDVVYLGFSKAFD